MYEKSIAFDPSTKPKDEREKGKGEKQRSELQEKYTH
jgi:hypothetical protein